jgi:hypothetical protein
MRHRDFDGARIHVPHAFEYADATAREAATGFVESEVTKIALQLDDWSYWTLIDYDPPTWNQIGGGGSWGDIAGTLADQTDLQSALVAKIPASYLDTDGTLAANSDSKIATQKAVKTYVDALPGGSPWTLLVDENGSSFANWTQVSGTWGSAGGYIKQTNAGSSEYRAKYNTKLPTGLIVFDADITIVSGVEGGSYYAALLAAWSGADSTSYASRVTLNLGDQILGDVDGYGNIGSISTTITLNVEYHIRAIFNGEIVTVYKDGTLLHTFGNLRYANNANGANASYIGLMVYRTQSNFRNIKVWAPTLPS